MAIRNAAEIDKNFAIETKLKREGLKFHDANELDVYGVQFIDGLYRRMEYAEAKKVSDNVALISSECAGGRVRFITNSPYIAIHVKYRSVSKVPNYSFTATLGFDLYSKERYIGAFVPSMDTVEAFDSVIDIKDTTSAREYTLNFPVCSEISELFIGVKDGSLLEKAPKYAIDKPIVFYGSSVTQGACASRPGNTYENMLSRTFNADYLNLGFWGNAKGEEAMANYIAGLTMSAFIYDYDYNAPSVEHLAATHEKMFQIIRKQHPTLPIVMLSAPIYYLNDAAKKRRDIIEQTYQNAVANGDKFVRFIAGDNMLEAVKDTALADNIHPGDSGFIAMANFIGDALKDLLEL